jgi:hypothetical protein
MRERERARERASERERENEKEREDKRERGVWSARSKTHLSGCRPQTNFISTRKI